MLKDNLTGLWIPIEILIDNNLFALNSDFLDNMYDICNVHFTIVLILCQFTKLLFCLLTPFY